MPIVAYKDQPSLQRIAAEGQDVISAKRAKHQDIRELHIGFLNMMPDAAFMATERQFFRLIGASNGIIQFYVHPIKLEGVTRNAEISSHIEEYYEAFSDITEQGIDALIVTGANPTRDNIIDEDYWAHASEVFEWADKNVTSIFFSCLSTHAILQSRYQIMRKPLACKIWGVYPHHVQDKQHPLVSNINSKFDMPHSRGNGISETDLHHQGLKILVRGEQSGVALATSKDGIRHVFCQGHPEYDSLSLLKEFKREIGRFANNERTDYPEPPNHYLSPQAVAILTLFKQQLLANEVKISDFPDMELAQHIDNTWRDTAKAIFSNWLGIVYRITNVDRKKQFMDGINPNSPLEKRTSEMK